MAAQPQRPAADGETINIVANAWTASALNAEIAKQLIESELGNPVEIVAIDENTMFTGLSDGSARCGARGVAFGDHPR